MRLPRSGLAPTIAIGLLVLFVGFSWYAGTESDDHFWPTDTHGGDFGGRDIHIRHVYQVEPGDRIDLWMADSFTGKDLIRDNVRFYIVEGGEAESFKQGQRPDHVLLETEVWAGKKTFYRPEIYAGKPHEEGLNGDYYDALDLVWMYAPTPGMTAGQQRIEEMAWKSTLGNFHYDVYDGAWLTTQMVATAAAAVTAIVAAVLIKSWSKNRLNPPAPEGPAVERMIVLQERAMHFLRVVRDFMRLAGAFLVAGSLAILFLASLVLDLEPAQPYAGWEITIIGSVFVVLSLVFWVWLVQYRRISHEYRRWRAAKPPFNAAEIDA